MSKPRKDFQYPPEEEFGEELRSWDDSAFTAFPLGIFRAGRWKEVMKRVTVWSADTLQKNVFWERKLCSGTRIRTNALGPWRQNNYFISRCTGGMRRDISSL